MAWATKECYNLSMNQKYNFLILAGIIVLGAFLRLWQLNQLPPGLYPDEAINGNDALNSPGQVFYPENNGREGLFHNLLALSFAIFGPSVWALRVVPAVIGILTILGVYLLTKELLHTKNPKFKILNSKQYQNSNFKIQNIFGHLNLFRVSDLEFRVSYGDKTALLSAFFIAASFWHINFSRIGFRAILLPLVLTFCFYFLLKGLRTKVLRDIIIAGIIFGLGFYTYISFRLSVLLIPFIFIPYLIFYKRQGALRQFWLFWLWFTAMAVIVALPITLYFISHPQDFVSRASGISIFAQDNPLAAFVESFVKHLAMFNLVGDLNWRHNISGSPMLFWPLGILFLIGLIIAIGKILKSFTHSRSYLTENFRCLFLLGWFLVMLLPGALTSEGLPHALRVIGVIPAVMIISALGGIYLYNFFEKFTLQKPLLKASVATILILIAVGGYHQYFMLWGQSNEVKGAFTQNYVKMGTFLNALPPDTKKYVIVNEGGVPVPYPDGIPMPSQTLIFIENTLYRPQEEKTVYLKPDELGKIKLQGKTIILPMKENPEIFTQLLVAFPQGKIQRENEFFVYVVE